MSDDQNLESGPVDEGQPENKEVQEQTIASDNVSSEPVTPASEVSPEPISDVTAPQASVDNTAPGVVTPDSSSVSSLDTSSDDMPKDLDSQTLKSPALQDEPPKTSNSLPAGETSGVVVDKKTARRKFNSKSLSRLIVEALLVIIILLLGAYVFSLRHKNTNLNNQLTTLKNNPQLAVEKQDQQIMASVSRLVQLPQGETPTIATVNNAAQAKKDSPFFDSAQNGDKVLIYVKAGEAILYRPSTNKIIKVAPLTFNNSSTTGTSSTNTSSTKKN